ERSTTRGARDSAGMALPTWAMRYQEISSSIEGGGATAATASPSNAAESVMSATCRRLNSRASESQLVTGALSSRAGSSSQSTDRGRFIASAPSSHASKRHPPPAAIAPLRRRPAMAARSPNSSLAEGSVAPGASRESASSAPCAQAAKGTGLQSGGPFDSPVNHIAPLLAQRR